MDVGHRAARVGVDAEHPRTPHGLQDATTNLGAIDKFWEQWPKAKVIIATGLEGVIAVTVKGPKGKLAFKKILGDEDEASLETLQFFDRGLPNLCVADRSHRNARRRDIAR